MTTDFLFILDVESFHIVPASSISGGRNVLWSAQRGRWVWEKGEKKWRTQGRSQGRYGPFLRVVETVKRASAPRKLGHTKSL